MRIVSSPLSAFGPDWWKPVLSEKSRQDSSQRVFTTPQPEQRSNISVSLSGVTLPLSQLPDPTLRDHYACIAYAIEQWVSNQDLSSLKKSHISYSDSITLPPTVIIPIADSREQLESDSNAAFSHLCDRGGGRIIWVAYCPSNRTALDYFNELDNIFNEQCQKSISGFKLNHLKNTPLVYTNVEPIAWELSGC